MLSTEDVVYTCSNRFDLIFNYDILQANLAPVYKISEKIQI